MEAKADKLMEEGEKKLTGFAPFTSDDEKAEKARDKFLQAGTQYKAAGTFLRAASAYQRASDMSQRTHCESDFISDCEEAAKCFRKANDSRSTDLFMRIIDLFDKNQKYADAAKYCVQLAETAPGREAVEWLNRAVKYYRSSRSNVTANEIVTKIADMHIKNNDLEEARVLFDKLGREALDDRLARGGARKLLFYALLCQLGSITGSNLSEGVQMLQERFEEYCDLDNQFNEHTREHMLIKELVQALEEQDIERYEAAEQDFIEVCPLDPTKTKLILKAKQVLRNADIR